MSALCCVGSLSLAHHNACPAPPPHYSSLGLQLARRERAGEARGERLAAQRWMLLAASSRTAPKTSSHSSSGVHNEFFRHFQSFPFTTTAALISSPSRAEGVDQEKEAFFRRSNQAFVKRLAGELKL